MKRVGYLFDRVIDSENLRLAFWKASRGKRVRDDQRRFQANLGMELRKLREGLIAGDYPIGEYRRFLIFDPKEREICAATFHERVLQHALMNVCEEYFDRWLIFDSYACRKGKGQVAAVKRASEFAYSHEWFMKCDIRKYFDSIPHDRLMAALERRFKDPFVLAWFSKILGVYEKSPGRGLPIGNLTSQHFANFYLNPLDRFVSLPYVRYMDDFVFWAQDKRRLLTLRDEIAGFVRDRLGLELKQEPFVNRTKHGMDFLGMRVFPRQIRLSRASKVRYRRKLKAYEKMYEDGIWDEKELQTHATALTAFTEQADSKAWRQSILAASEKQRGRTVCCAAAAGTTTRGIVAPRTATGTTLTTATTTTGSASFAPQHRRTNRAVPAGGQFPQSGTNNNRRTGASSKVENPGTPPFQEDPLCHR